jgi:hypothetical protein
MEITYDAWWTNDDGADRVTHGVLTEEDLLEAVERKEDRSTINHEPVIFDTANWDKVEL